MISTRERIENDLVAADGLGELMELMPAMLAVRATKMFTERATVRPACLPLADPACAPPAAKRQGHGHSAGVVAGRYT